MLVSDTVFILWTVYAYPVVMQYHLLYVCISIAEWIRTKLPSKVNFKFQTGRWIKTCCVPRTNNLIKYLKVCPHGGGTPVKYD